jgi:hypothetical protein
LAVQSPVRATVGRAPPRFTLNSAEVSTGFAGLQCRGGDFRVALPGEI